MLPQTLHVALVGRLHLDLSFIFIMCMHEPKLIITIHDFYFILLVPITYSFDEMRRTYTSLNVFLNGAQPPCSK